MGLAWIEISNIRNLQPVRLNLCSGFNALHGLNGSGKTSFLEALYILGRGTSFRSKNLDRVIRIGANNFYVSGKLEPNLTPLGFEYQTSGPQIRIAGQPARSRMQLAEHMPLLFISPESQSLISEGPQQRRRFLDWGVFHVEPGFLPTYRLYQRALKQRNKALGYPGIESAWDSELARAAEQVTQYRSEYVNKLVPYVEQYIQQLLNIKNVSLHFSPGWRHEISYSEVLRSSLANDREYGFTRHGPHRADITLKVENRLVRDTLSRGQQKIMVFALLLAQVALLNDHTATKPLIMIDELAAEIDVEHRKRLMSVLAELNAQIFITLTEKRALEPYEYPLINWFHVEQGCITKTK